MTVLTIKEISDNVKKIEEQEDVFSFSQTPEQLEYIAKLLMTLTESSQLAKSVITSKLDEEVYANFRSVAINTLLTMMAQNNSGAGLVMSAMSGELVGFVDSVTMAIIGTLINEEVL